MSWMNLANQLRLDTSQVDLYWLGERKGFRRQVSRTLPKTLKMYFLRNSSLALSIPIVSTRLQDIVAKADSTANIDGL